MAALNTETPPHAWGRLIPQSLQRGGLGNTLTCVGRLNTTVSIPSAYGNTPTCVGKTKIAGTCHRIFRKHPHVCGEDHHPPHPRGDEMETPPRVWGRLYTYKCITLCNRNTPTYVGRPDRRCRFTGVVRNTPTCVGKTILLFLCTGYTKKHPHMRGEDFALK